MQQQDVKPGNPRGPRRDVEFGAFAERPDGTEAVVTISNLSYDGCQLMSGENFRTGERVKLNLPQLGHIVAEIRWSVDRNSGALFIVDEHLAA